jgi:hypothetical protein
MARGAGDSRVLWGRRRGGLGLLLAATALALAGCGTGSPQHFADKPRPAVPVDLTVYVDNQHVSVSPARVGAGPVILYVTNQASHTQNVAITTARGRSVASSGRINAGATAQITANLKRGSYRVRAAAHTAAARLRITHPRPNADNVLLQP